MDYPGQAPLITGFTRNKPYRENQPYGATESTTTMPYPQTAYGMPPDPSYPIGFDDLGNSGMNLPYPNNPSPSKSYPLYPTDNLTQPAYPSELNIPPRQSVSVGFEGTNYQKSPQDDTPKKRVKSPKRPSSRIGDIEDGREKVSASNFTMFRDGRRKIDYILAYEPHDQDPQRQKNRALKRETFEKNLKAIGLELEREDVENSCDGKTVFVKIHIPWGLMCRKAEELKMKMPLKSRILKRVRVVIFERVSLNLDPDEVVIVKESEMDIRSTYDKFIESLCCFNPFALHDAEIPEDLNSYTCAFRVDRMDKFYFPENKEDFFSAAQRSRVVHRIINTCRYDDRRHYQIGITRLITNSSYTAAYPLHSGPYKCDKSTLTHKQHTDRQLLYLHWARPGRWFKEQPLDLIRRYFGEKIGLYFTWLGYYTTMLFPAAIMGVVVIIFGLATMASYQPIVDLCDTDSNFPMCPKCDKKCEYTSLSDSCSYTKVTYVLDNPFTIVFAIFMSFWATFFLEFWKRKQSEVQYDWDMIGYSDEEEQPRPEFEAAVPTLRLNPVTKLEEPYIANSRVCPRYVIGINCVVLMIVVVLVAIMSVVMYRMAVYAAIASTSSLDMAWIGVIASSTAALINLIAIMILNKLYEKVAHFLTEWEMPKTQTMFDDLFTFKMYLFQFVNFYGSLFYIAFLKLAPGSPNEYNRIFQFRREEDKYVLRGLTKLYHFFSPEIKKASKSTLCVAVCSCYMIVVYISCYQCNPAGCLFELGLQLCVIMLGKQLFNNFIEIVIPKLKKWWRGRDNIHEELSKMPQWEHDYDLVETHQQGLFYEYLEMVIQYGFITIFVAAFPLGPLFALINNLIEIRVDSYKYVAVFRRHYSERVEHIGIWFEILTSVAKISVVVNAFVIGFVSEFVPRIYYEVTSSPDGSLDGFLNSTLSCFDINDFTENERPLTPFKFQNNSCGFGKQMCRYRGYYQAPYKFSANGTVVRNENAYQFSPAHWHIIAGKLFFVIAFEHLIFAVVGIIAWIIPDVPQRLDQLIKRENYIAKMAARGESEAENNTSTLRMDNF